MPSPPTSTPLGPSSPPTNPATHGHPDRRQRADRRRAGAPRRFPVLDVNLATDHARVWADLAAAGTRVGPNDLWLAATAIAHGLTLATANLREFERVPGLDVEAWGRDEDAAP